LTARSRRAYDASMPPRDPSKAAKSIGALYRKMSSWYIVFTLVVFVFILVVGYRFARPLLPYLFQ
jgi:hypothetical protein